MENRINIYYSHGLIGELLQEFSDASANNDWVAAIDALEQAVNLGYKGDYSILYKAYLSKTGLGNLAPNYEKGIKWLNRFYKDYKNGEMDYEISAETMLEVCYSIGVSYAQTLKCENSFMDIEYTENLFYEAIDYGKKIETPGNNTAKYLFIIGCCFYYGKINFEDNDSITIENNYLKAFDALFLAEKFENITATFLIAQMMELGLGLFRKYTAKERKYYAQLRYVTAAISKEEHAIAWCQKNFIDALPWEKLDIWDKIHLPSENLQYMKEKKIYNISYNEFKQLKIEEIISGHSRDTLILYFSTIRKYMEDIILYLDINSNPIIKGLSLLKTNKLDNYDHEQDIIYNNIIKGSFFPDEFIEYIDDISFTKESRIKKLKSKEYDIDIKKKILIELLLKRTLCLAYEISRVYKLEMEDISSVALCGLVEAVNKYKLNEKNYSYYIMKFVLKYISDKHYDNQISRLSEIKSDIYQFDGINEVDNTAQFEFKLNIVSRKRLETDLFEDNFELICDKVDINRYLSMIGKKEQKIIRLHYGIGCNKKNSTEISKIYGVSRQRVIQIEQKGLEKIKNLYYNKTIKNVEYEQIHKYKYLKKDEQDKIYNMIDAFYQENIYIHFFDKKKCEMFILEYYKRLEININQLLEQFEKMLSIMPNDSLLCKKKNKLYSFKSTFIVTRVCMIYKDKDLDDILKLIEKSIKGFQKLKIENKVTSSTIKQVDRFIAGHYDKISIKKTNGL